MTSTFQQRLQRCRDRGNLTVADLGRWFGRPYPTVRTWLVNGWEPGDGPVTRRRMQARLVALEHAVSQNAKELRDLPMRERAQRLEQLARQT